MKRAMVERARIEAQAELRLVEVEQARKHELSLLQMREQQRATHYRALSWLSGGACALSLLGWSVAYFGFIAPANARTEQHLRSLVERSSGRASAAERALEVERKKLRELSTAITAPPAAAAEPAPQAVKPKPPSLQPGSGHRATPGGAPPPACEDNGDPLNSCLNGPRKPPR